MRRLGISEILNKASETNDADSMVIILRENNSNTLQTILLGAFHSNIVWLLPKEPPPYKPNNLVDQQGILYTESRKLYLFIEGGNNSLTKIKRENLFIQLLETLDPEDAKLILAIKNKTLPYPNITPEIVNVAFPGLIA
jgi:hypothetical protein